MYNNNQLTSLINFSYALHICFAPSQLDAQKSLSELQQMSSARDCQILFELLSNHVIGFPTNFLLTYLFWG